MGVMNRMLREGEMREGKKNREKIGERSAWLTGRARLALDAYRPIAMMAKKRVDPII